MDVEPYPRVNQSCGTLAVQCDGVCYDDALVPVAVTSAPSAATGSSDVARVVEARSPGMYQTPPDDGVGSGSRIGDQLGENVCDPELEQEFGDYEHPVGQGVFNKDVGDDSSEFPRRLLNLRTWYPALVQYGGCVVHEEDVDRKGLCTLVSSFQGCVTGSVGSTREVLGGHHFGSCLGESYPANKVPVRRYPATSG